MASSHRVRRVESAVQQELGRLFTRGLKDPRVGFVTVTGVKMAPDLRSGTVYYRVSGDEKERADTARGLDSASAFLKGEVGRALQLKWTPELRFVYDESAERAERIEELLAEIRQQDAARAQDAEEASDEREGDE